jgi:mono/diheme cytochrome c family protein
MIRISIALVCLVVAAAQGSNSWVVPDEVHALKNPVPESSEALERALASYKKECRGCHGETGKGDGKMARYIKPPPMDLTKGEVQKSLSDGEIFYKITHGRNPMPRYQQKLTEHERWEMVHYVRSLGRKGPST